MDKVRTLRSILTVLVFSVYTISNAQTVELEVIELINKFRTEMGGPEKGLSPFKRNSALDSAAIYHAKWIVASGTNSHVESNSVKGIAALAEFTDRAAKYGATALAENFIQYCIYVRNNGELNIEETASLVFNAWKNSNGHRENMLVTMPKHVEPRIGVAIVPYDEHEFCIVMITGANVDSSSNLIRL